MARFDKKAKRGVKIKGIKSAAETKLTGGYFKYSPVFIFRKYDSDAPWANARDGKPSIDHLFKIIKGFENLTWNEIFTASGSRLHGTNSHYIKLADLSSAAKRRADNIGLNEDELFDFHLEGDARFWGIIEPDGKFFVIWYDPNHQVMPYRKK